MQKLTEQGETSISTIIIKNFNIPLGDTQNEQTETQQEFGTEHQPAGSKRYLQNPLLDNTRMSVFSSTGKIFSKTDHILKYLQKRNLNQFEIF